MTLRALTDIAERTVTTYLEVFVGLLIAAGVGAPRVDHLSILSTAALAAIPAALAVIKGGLATLMGPASGASLLPTESNTPAAVPSLPDDSAAKTLAPPGTQPEALVAAPLDASLVAQVAFTQRPAASSARKTSVRKAPAKKAAEIRKAAPRKKAR